MDPVRFSNLKRIAQSPAHYLAAFNQKSYAKERGSALHSLVLGGKRVVAYPGAVRRGKEWDAFEQDHADALILTKSEHSKTFAMAASVQANPIAMAALEGDHELEVNWEFLGRSCLSHIDVLGSNHVAELKSCYIGQPDRFAHNALRMGYHAQLAAYMTAASCIQRNITEAYIVAVESVPPYVVTTLKLTERALEHGARLFRLWFERLLACEKANEWPGYCQSIVPLDAPEDDVELTFGASGEVAEVSAEPPF